MVPFLVHQPKIEVKNNGQVALGQPNTLQLQLVSNKEKAHAVAPFLLFSPFTFYYVTIPLTFCCLLSAQKFPLRYEVRQICVIRVSGITDDDEESSSHYH